MKKSFIEEHTIMPEQTLSVDITKIKAFKDLKKQVKELKASLKQTSDFVSEDAGDIERCWRAVTNTSSRLEKLEKKVSEIVSNAHFSNGWEWTDIHGGSCGPATNKSVEDSQKLIYKVGDYIRATSPVSSLFDNSVVKEIEGIIIDIQGCCYIIEDEKGKKYSVPPTCKVVHIAESLYLFTLEERNIINYYLKKCGGKKKIKSICLAHHPFVNHCLGLILYDKKGEIVKDILFHNTMNGIFRGIEYNKKYTLKELGL